MPLCFVGRSMTDTVVWSLFTRQISRALLGTVGSPLPSYLLVRPHLLWLPRGNLRQHAASLPSNLEGMTPSLSDFPSQDRAPSVSLPWTDCECPFSRRTLELLSSTSRNRFLSLFIVAVWSRSQPPFSCLNSLLLTKQNLSVQMMLC